MPAPDFGLAGTALVTGAAGGIGAAVALGLAESGADVACVDVSGVEACVAAIEAVGRRAIAVPAADGDALTAAVARAQDELGPLRYAANCAGINDQGPGESMLPRPCSSIAAPSARRCTSARRSRWSGRSAGSA